MVTGAYSYSDDADLHPAFPQFIKRRNVLYQHAVNPGLTDAEKREIAWHKIGLPYTFIGCAFMDKPITVVRYWADGLGYDTTWYMRNNPAAWPSGFSSAPGAGLPPTWIPLVKGVDYPNELPFVDIAGQLHAMPEPWDILVQRVNNGEYLGIGH